MSASDIDTSEWGIIKSLLGKYQVGIFRVAIIALMIAVVAYIVFVPVQEYSIAGRVVRLTGNSLYVQVQSTGFGTPDNFDVDEPIIISQGICFADVNFGHANCRIGSSVEVAMLSNRAGMEWWYVSAVFEPNGGVPDVPSAEEARYV